MRKTFNTQFELINKTLDESVTVSYSATFRISPETKTEPEWWDIESVDFDVEYYPKWLPKQDIEGHVITHANEHLFSKNPKYPIFI